MEARQLMGDPDNDDTQAPLLLGLSGGFLLFSLLLLLIRLWSRLRPTPMLKADDLTILAAATLAMVNFVLLAFACAYGLGRRARFVPQANRKTVLRLVWSYQLVFYWALSLVKISVALLLLRLKSTARWKAFLYSIIGVLILTAVVQTFFQCLQCRPFSVYWDPDVQLRKGGVKCVPMGLIIAMIVANSTIHVAIDIMFSLIPISFIRKLNRPRSEKIFLSFLMGLGLFASLFAILRTSWLKNYGASGDLFKENVMATIWANLELELAMVAATIPTLKSFMQSVLSKIGNLFYEKETESQIRGRLVKMGFLTEEETGYENTEFMAEKKSKTVHVEKVKGKVNHKVRNDNDAKARRIQKAEADVGLERVGVSR